MSQTIRNAVATATEAYPLPTSLDGLSDRARTILARDAARAGTTPEALFAAARAAEASADWADAREIALAARRR